MTGIFKDKIFISAICIEKRTTIDPFNSHLHKGNNLFCYETNIKIRMSNSLMYLCFSCLSLLWDVLVRYVLIRRH